MSMATGKGDAGWPDKFGSVCLPSDICRCLLSSPPCRQLKLAVSRDMSEDLLCILVKITFEIQL